MKSILLLIIFGGSTTVGHCASPSEEFQEALSETEITSEPRPPKFSDTIIDPSFLRDIKKLPRDRKEKLAAQITPLIPQLLKGQPAEAISREVSPFSSGPSPMLGILILQEIGTDSGEATGQQKESETREYQHGNIRREF